MDPEKELSAFNLEHIDCEIQQDTSYVSAEVLLIEASEACGSPFADLDGVDDPKNAENIAVDAGVFSCCGSRRISMDKVHKGANKTMNTQEVENVGTGQPVTPEKTCAGFENPDETSHDISGKVLQQLFSSGSRWKETFCSEYFSTYKDQLFSISCLVETYQLKCCSLNEKHGLSNRQYDMLICMQFPSNITLL